MNTTTKTIIATLCVALLPALSVKADDICWNGSADTRWELDANWDDCSGNPAQVPTATDTAIIKSTAQRDCVVNDDRMVGVLKVEQGIRHLEVGNIFSGGVSLKVLDHAEIYGLVRILQTATLELAGTTTTTVDGVVVFWVHVRERIGGGSNPCIDDPVGTLLVSNNSTIEGDAGLGKEVPDQR